MRLVLSINSASQACAHIEYNHLTLLDRQEAARVANLQGCWQEGESRARRNQADNCQASTWLDKQRYRSWSVGGKALKILSWFTCSAINKTRTKSSEHISLWTAGGWIMCLWHNLYGSTIRSLINTAKDFLSPVLPEQVTVSWDVQKKGGSQLCRARISGFSLFFHFWDFWS